jgi:hypothetical protein
MTFECADRKGIDRRDALLSGGSLLVASASMGEALAAVTSKPANAQQHVATLPALPSDQIGDVATSAYVYAYPLILMELTRRLGTNVADTRQFARAPMNQFANVPAFPDATFTDITRPNADTLYSLMWFDVSKEPLLISVPDSGGRYYLLQMCDMWTDVFDSPGKRTTGTTAQVLAIAGPNWQGQLPAEATLIYSPTAINWITVYPTAFADADGKPLNSDNRYALHFNKDQVPAVNAFWSLTMYNEKQLFAANPIDRYAIGDRDKLSFNPDGSLDLYIQRDSPGQEKESNWLPAPASGPFTMNMRLYWPKPEVLDGSWMPTGVRLV